MPIKFRTMNVATSVVNRILNVADELDRNEQRRQQFEIPVVPNVPDPSIASKQIDQQLQQPTAEMPPLDDNPNSETANAIEPVLHGGTTLDGLVDTVSGQ